MTRDEFAEALFAGIVLCVGLWAACVLLVVFVG